MEGIYCYIDKKTDEIVYIGKDSNIHENRRHKDHLKPSRYDKQKFNRVLQNNPKRYKYKVLIKGEFNNFQLNELEKTYIRHFNTYRPYTNHGFNFTIGGDGVTGYIHTEEARKKISEANKNPSEETRKKISEAKKGENHPRAFYDLWDIQSVHFHKPHMFNYGNADGLNPRKCFMFKYNGKKIPIGRFHDFTTVELINKLVEEAIR